MKMGRNIIAVLMVLLVIISYGAIMAIGYDGEGRGGREEEEEEEEEWGRGERGREWGGGERERRETGWEGEEREWEGEGLVLQESKQVIRTEAGEMRVVRSLRGRMIGKHMDIGFLTMEPKTLFVPQYLDSSLIIFVRRGEARLGSIYKDEFVDRRLKMGDIYRIPAGSAFYLVNTAEGQRLHVICSIDPSESLGFETFQSFYIGGGTYPKSVLSGFDIETLTTAFNVSGAELREILTSRVEGPIVYISGRAPTMWTKFLQLKEQDRQKVVKKMVGLNQESSDEYKEHDLESEEGWSWRKLLGSVFAFGQKEENIGPRSRKAPDSYNIYDRTPDFRNNYGWTIALDHGDYKPLKNSGIGVYLVNLTAGSMVAPHINPTATEYGVVLRGSGRIQVVSPNGTSLLDAEVNEGDVFVVPRYFAFCQIASRTGPLEFFGFTTSARRNRPQFLVGSNSLLRALSGPELAAAFGTDEDRLRAFIEAQREGVILPPPAATVPPEAPPEEEEKTIKGGKVLPEAVRAMGREMIMTLD